jgi:DNA-directed RNA polymerase subunit RPC12/RpoP
MYLIINCYSCGKIIMASTASRTKSCTHCGAKVDLHGARVLARSNTTTEAVAIIQELKQRKSKDSPVTFKKFRA